MQTSPLVYYNDQDRRKSGNPRASHQCHAPCRPFSTARAARRERPQGAEPKGSAASTPKAQRSGGVCEAPRIGRGGFKERHCRARARHARDCRHGPRPLYPDTPPRAQGFRPPSQPQKADKTARKDQPKEKVSPPRRSTTLGAQWGGKITCAWERIRPDVNGAATRALPHHRERRVACSPASAALRRRIWRARRK